MLACAGLFLCTPPPSWAAAPAPAQKSPEYKVVGYYLARGDRPAQPKPDSIQASRLTHLNYAFATIRDGEIAFSDVVPIQRTKEDLEKLAKLKHHNPKLRILISVGGWSGSKDFSNVALTSDTRAKFADSAITFIRTYGLDGIDIDWEFPVVDGEIGNSRRPEDKQNYTLLLQALHDKLTAAGQNDHRSYLLTAATGNNEKFLNNTEMAKVAQILDWANVMTYDFNGHWNEYAGHNSPLYNDPTLKHDGARENANINSMIDLMLQAGVPPNKMVLGMPFYGYSWKQCGAANHGQLQDCQGKGRGTWEDGSLDFFDIDANLVNKKGFVRYWNDTSKVPYLFNSDTGEFVSYDDLKSFDYKIKYLKARGLAGAMFWEITDDRNFVLEKKLAHDLLGK
jgi:chitinase